MIASAFNFRTVSGRLGMVCCCICWIAGSLIQAVSRSDGRYEPSLAGRVGLCVIV